MSEAAPPRILSAADVQFVYGHFAGHAVELFNREGAVAPQLFLVRLEATATPQFEALAALEPELVQALHRDGANKDVLGELIRTLLRPELRQQRPDLVAAWPQPHVVVHIFETWWVPVSGNAESLELPPSQHADRREAVTVSVHTPDDTYAGMSQVDPQTRRCVLAPLNLETGFAGRLAMHAEPPVTH